MAHNRSRRVPEIRRRRHRRAKRLNLRKKLAMSKDEMDKQTLRERLIKLGAPESSIA